MTKGHDHEMVLLNQAMRIGLTFSRENITNENFYENLKKNLI